MKCNFYTRIYRNKNGQLESKKSNCFFIAKMKKGILNMNNTEKEIKPKQYIRLINGIPYKVTLHCKTEGETFKEKLERVIKNKILYQEEREDK